MAFPFECPVCGQKNNMPKTNADRIRAMSDEELDYFLSKVTYGMDECPYEYGSEKALEWLQQPAKDEYSECTYHALDRDDLSHHNYCQNYGANIRKGKSK